MPDCYLHDLNCCSPGLSREHLVSDAVLAVIGKTLQVEGLPWLKDETKLLPASALVARCLCRDHNSALSPLDTAGARFFRAIVNCRYGGPARHYTFSGHDLERWLLKTTMAFAVSSNLSYKAGEKHPGHLIDGVDVARMLEDERAWPDCCGMFFNATIGDAMRVDNIFELAPVLHPDDNAIVGLNMKLQGLLWRFVLDQKAGRIFRNTNENHYRPSHIAFRHPHGIMHKIELCWADGLQHKPMVMESREPPLPGVPQEDS